MSSTSADNSKKSKSSSIPISAATAVPSSKKSSIPPTPQNTPVAQTPLGKLAQANTKPSSAQSTAAPAASSAAPTNMGKKQGSKAVAKQQHRHEEEEDDDDIDIDEGGEDIEALMAKNPALAAALKEKLGQMMASGNIDPSLLAGLNAPLPAEVQRRIKALKNLEDKQAEIDAEFRKELQALEKKFHDKAQTLYDQRAKIVSGDVEPTDAECEREDSDYEDEEEHGGAKIKEITGDDEEEEEKIKGIPEFWLNALQNHPMIAETIEETDMPALAALKDISLSIAADAFSYTLTFTFDKNDYFTNTTLTKTYTLQNPVSSEYDDLIYSKSEGSKIDWKPEQNLTVKIETKKQRHKGSKKTRVVKREVPQPSFFRFFSPPQIPDRDQDHDHDHDDEDEEHEHDHNIDPELEEEVERDFELGEVFKLRIVKHAIDWFTGKALENYGDYDDEDEEGEDEDDEGEDDEDDEDEDDDEDDGPAPRGASAAAAKPGEKPECKQQ